MTNASDIPSCVAKPDCSRIARIRMRALIAKYDSRVPRYTSYPTAAQFEAGVTSADYRSWLSALVPAQPASLYLHIPFCDRLCWYCGCHTGVVRRHAPITDYVETLMGEVRLIAAAAPRLAIANLHLGGGTPNILSRRDLRLLSQALRDHFMVLPDCEIAAELDPRVLTGEWVEAAAEFGIKRVSLGVQDLSPEVQAAINRRQGYEVLAWAVAALRAAGMASINLDLMYGLPRQTVAGALTTIDQVLALDPDRIALFGYAHVPWMKPNQKLIKEADLPDAWDRFEQQRAIAERLEAAGYVRIGLDHFAKPGDPLALAATYRRMRRNFQGYTTDGAETIIGIGASSISHLPQGYAQNLVAVPAWRERIVSGELATSRGVAPSPDDRFRAEIIERLMCALTVDLREICGKHDRPLSTLSGELDRLREFEDDGLVRGDGAARLEITPIGRPFMRTICAVFDRHLRPGSGRHASSV
ncbi:MAG: oxygen-independent coproporphyrinogen III oxidase [Hyphomicrobiales bacterium]